MRVLLCCPFRDDAYHKVGFIVPPLGLGYIAAVLRENGHEPLIQDFNIDRGEPNYEDFDVVGISCDTSRFKAGVEIARKAKAAGRPVVMGGPHVTFRDGEALGSGVCDYVVRGEGEWTMLELMNSLRDGKDIGAVRGVSFLSKHGDMVRTPDAGPPDVRSLPMPARDLLKMNEYRKLEMGGRKITSVVTSRGCPYNCSFCSSSEFSGLKWRANDPRSVVDEIEEIVTGYGFPGIAFLDDNFTLKPERVNEICAEIVGRDLDIYWWCFSRADTILRNEEMVSSMAKAGARYVFMGFESRSAATLNKYEKKLDPSAAKEAVRLLKSHGIATHASFILGGIHETGDMAADTIRYAREIAPEAVQFSLLTPYPGTKLFEEARERIVTYDWDLYDCLHPVLRLDHLGPEELPGLLIKAYRSFYLTPRRIYNGLFSAFRGKGIKLGSILKIMRGIS
jgi:anaerobic magnesium-protoporphyrin IX monomethyl ester cyclase